jgi:hypothetical protein
VGGPTFQITSLDATGCRVADHNTQTGDDRGGIAVSNDNVFYTGDTATGRFNLESLAGASVGRVYDSLVSNLRSGAVYVLANGTTPLTDLGGTASALIEINGTTGAPTTTTIALSAPIAMSGLGRVGIFSGYDRAVILAGGRAYHVALPSGQVTDLGAVALPTATACENWAIWGVAEFYGGALYVDFVQSPTVIARMRLPDGAVTPLSTFTALSDMCSFTVSPTLRRWYFHYEGSGQFGGSAETVGYCNAQLSAEGLACPMGTTACGGPCRNLQTDVANCGACGAACAAGQACNAGVCGCPTGTTLCGGACANVQTDRANCGACGNACAGTTRCVAGACIATTGYTAGPAPSDVTWVDVCGTQRVLASIDDDATSVTIPFEFPWWAGTVAAGARVNVCTNGFLNLDGLLSTSLAGTLPSAVTPNSVIAPHWGDLVTGTSGICVGAVGTAPNRRWVVQWSGARNYAGGGSLNFEAILHEGSGIIDFVYADMTGATARTAGVENPGGTAAVGACGSTTCTPTSNSRVRFTPGA